jgi:hypothetical protein
MNSSLGMNPQQVRAAAAALEAQIARIDAVMFRVQRAHQATMNPDGYGIDPGAFVVAPWSIGALIAARGQLAKSRTAIGNAVVIAHNQATQQERVSNASGGRATIVSTLKKKPTKKVGAHGSPLHTKTNRWGTTNPDTIERLLNRKKVWIDGKWVALGNPRKTDLWNRRLHLLGLSFFALALANANILNINYARAYKFLAEYLTTPEGRIIIGWLLGLSPKTMQFGEGSGLVSHMKNIQETKDARALIIEQLKNGTYVGPVPAGYTAGTPSPTNPNFIRDAWTYSHWSEASPQARLLAALGSYQLTATVTYLSPDGHTAIITYSGSNSTTLGSAIGINEEMREILNKYAEITGNQSETKQTFSWQEVVTF